MRLLLLTTLATAVALTPLSAPAANLLNYSFSSNLDPTTQSGVTGTGFLANGGSKAEVGIGNGGNNSDPGGNYAFILITKSSTNISNSVSNKQFAQFSITPPAKEGMQLAQIQFVAARGGNSNPRGLALRWSLDGYTSNLGTKEITTTWPSTKSYTFNVNSFAGSTVTFRLYAYADEISNAAPSIRFDSLILTGSVIVYPPTVTPQSTNISTSKTSAKIKGSAYSSVGIARVEVAKNSPNGVYSGANGTTNWNYTATSLKKGKNVFYFRSVDENGQVSPAVKVTVRRTTNPKPSPTPSSTP